MGTKTAIGARAGSLSGLRRLVATAMAQDLKVYILPGPDMARACGLDVAKAGLRLAATPRHANVLLVIGQLPEGLRDAASVVYAQMPRPRTVLALGADDPAQIPMADVMAPLSQDGLLSGLEEVRRMVSTGAFQNDIVDFTAPALDTRVEYTCPMHPKVISDQPGDCPKCGMTLVPREAGADTGHAGHSTGSKEGAGMEHKVSSEPPAPDHSKHAATKAAKYTCPMHPEVTSDAPGSCPMCGMHLVPADAPDAHAGHGKPDHGKHAAAEADKDPHKGHKMMGGAEGIEPHFMSMAALTKDKPRSSDGLQMDWIKVPFGPFFPGLPGGLALEFTLDGDTVAKTGAHSLVDSKTPLVPLKAGEFVSQLVARMPLAPVSYGHLAAVALENAAGISVAKTTAQGRVVGLERERVASHLSWLADFGVQSGLGWLGKRAGGLQLEIQTAGVEKIATLAPAIAAMLRRLQATPLLRMRLGRIAWLGAGVDALGPVARASGDANDARSSDVAYAAFDFSPALRTEGDALARLGLRCDEILESLRLIAAVGADSAPEPDNIGSASGHGTAFCETPRGLAQLHVQLDAGTVIKAQLSTPSMRHLDLIEGLTAQQELGDALVTVASLDISPWEIGLDFDRGKRP
jgi:Ni,Fe-hydrogenase III large subunit/DNA-directed RNA polymerase subunit M/transcription elongation factor TFIIS